MLEYSVYHLLKKTNVIFSLPNRLKISLPKDEARGHEIYNRRLEHIMLSKQKTELLCY